jgi:dTMP kinase
LDTRDAGPSGSFITFEGVEGAGKSTRCLTLVRKLEADGIPVLHTREPGGPPASERIREVLLDPGLTVTPLTELMLYLASRASNTELLIRPSLERGLNVICERFSDATFAYQIGGRGLPEDPVRNADLLATGGLRPDLVILLDLDPEAGLARLSRQGRERDRIEQEEIRFHRRVRDMYLKLASGDPRYLVVDGEKEPHIQDRIIEEEVRALLKKR